MTFVLSETAAGYALFKAKDKKLYKSGDILSELASPESVVEQFKIKAFEKFESAAEALTESNALIEAKVSEKLAHLLDELKEEKKPALVVSDPKLGTAISKLPGLSLNIVTDTKALDILRAVREHLGSLLPGLDSKNLVTMSLGLAHSIGRHKLKFSADKVDVMIVQAIALLDDLDKEVNVYAMRLKEWYGWHFPEMAKIVTDNMAYARVIQAMGSRTNAATTDLSDVLPEDIEEKLKQAAEVSMGTEISETDLKNVEFFASQVIKLAVYRENLSNYLNSRMAAIAPNLTALVGELVGARLISHSGSMTNLAKAPSSTLQILGAEKALFRALKTKHDTPKYGILYHASLVGQANGRNKGKIARMLAAKASLSARYDALAENRPEEATLGLDDRVKIEKRLAQLEGRDYIRPAANARQAPKVSVEAAAGQYNADADATMAGDSDDESDSEVEAEVEVEEKKEKKRKRSSSVAEVDADAKKEAKEAKKSKKDRKSKDKESKESKKSKKSKKEKA